jgi:non-ribosomal peptide synthetase component F
MSDSGEIVLAGWLDGRAQPDLEHAVGPYSQPVPIRSRLQDGTSFAEVLDQVQRSRAAAARRQDSAAVTDLDTLADRAGVGFSHVTVGPLRAPVSEIVALSAPTAAVALALSVRVGEASLDAEVTYDPAAFEQRDAEDVAVRFRTLLQSAAADPAQPVSRLLLVDDDERTALIASAATTPPRGDASTPIHHRFEAQAALTPDRVAVAGASEQMSYAELNEAANRLAHHLNAVAATPGAPVGLCMERTPSMLVALLAILKAGRAYVPLNFEHPPARLAHLLTESGALAAVTEQHLTDRLQGFDGAIVSVDGDRAAIAQSPPTNPDRVTAPDALVYIMYTSGSTGTPKGVAVTHRNLSTYVASVLERLAVDDRPAPEGLRFGVVSAVSTDLGNTSLFTPLVSGGCVQLIGAEASMDGEAFAAELGDTPLDVIKITPSHLRALLGDDSAAVLPRR